MLAEIHVSDVLAFKRCRRAWNWSSLLRENLTPKRVYAPFFTGRLIHYALEKRYKYGWVVDQGAQQFMEVYHKENPDLDDSDRELMDREFELAIGILSHYVLWQAHDNSITSDQNFEFIQLESLFKVPLRTPKGKPSAKMLSAGRFDGIVKRLDNGKLYLWENKTTRSISERLKMLELEEQTDTYLLAAQELLGVPVAGTVYTLIRKKLPERPTLLQNGTLSLNKSIDTSAEYLAWFLREFFQIRDEDFALRQRVKQEYGALINAVALQPNKFFQRVIIHRSQTELKNASTDRYRAAEEMISPRTPIYPHFGPHCNYCLYREPCIMMQQGLDPTRYLEQNYVQNTYHLDRTDD